MTSPQAPNMTSILDRPSNTIERPRPLPVGTYQFQVKGQPRYDKSKNGNEFAEFQLVPLAKGEDVDEEALKDALTVKATGEIKPLAEKLMKPQFYYGNDFGAAMLREFVDACGVPDPELSLRERIPGTAGTQVLGHVRHRPTQDGKGIQADIDSFGPIE